MKNILSDVFDVKLTSHEAAFLNKLGLTESPIYKCHECAHLGEVRPFVTDGEEDEPSDTQTVISVYMTPMPAKFYRFEIHRKCEDGGGMEWITVETGSGTLETYWPMALAVAEHMIVIRAEAGQSLKSGTPQVTLPPVTPAQLDAVLAGLRLLAEHVAAGKVKSDDDWIGSIWSNDGQHEGLDSDAIHNLAESLNGG